MRKLIGTLTIVVAVFVVGLITSTAGSALAQIPAVLAPAGVTADGSEPAPSPTYATNAQGQTFGSAMSAVSPDTEPDLILVVATNGREGYVLKAELDDANGTTAAATFKSPEEALVWQSAHTGPVSVPVYQSDGRTPVGEFTVMHESEAANAND